jgi:hypothetical protein
MIDRRSFGARDFGQRQEHDHGHEIEHQADDCDQGDSLGSLASRLIAGYRQGQPQNAGDEQDDN